MKLHVQLDDYRDGDVDTVAFTIDTAVLDDLSDGQRATVQAAITEALIELEADGITDPVTALAAGVTRRIADARAYKREAAHRGVLAL